MPDIVPGASDQGNKPEIVMPGVEINHGLINPDKSAVMAAHLIDLFGKLDRATDVGGTIVGGQATRFIDVGVVLPKLDEVTREVLDRLEIPDQSSFMITRQPPGYKPKFHIDGAKAIVIHPMGGGAYDYAPDARHDWEADQKHLSVPIGVGDIMRSYLPHLYHRGRNPSQEDRYNVTILYPREY